MRSPRSWPSRSKEVEASRGASTVARLRETHRRRPTLIAILDRAKLTGGAEASRGG
jgi:hypothetical protein